MTSPAAPVPAPRPAALSHALIGSGCRCGETESNLGERADVRDTRPPQSRVRAVRAALNGLIYPVRWSFGVSEPEARLRDDEFMMAEVSGLATL